MLTCPNERGGVSPGFIEVCEFTRGLLSHETMFWISDVEDIQ
jgi:hypothetical protein